MRWIFKRFCSLGAGTKPADDLNSKGQRTKAWTTKKGVDRDGEAWHKGHLHRFLRLEDSGVARTRSSTSAVRAAVAGSATRMP